MDFSGNGGREVTYYKNVKLKDSPLFLKINIIAINKLRELFLDYFPITFYYYLRCLQKSQALLSRDF